MAADDANEGHGRGECIEHRWKIRTVVLASDGAHIQSECLRCGALTIETPNDLNPGRDKLRGRRRGPGHQPPSRR